ncbi:MAG TPA: cyclase family protein [Solirubrobacteraceae bacterium]|nr:cyclase family protein [Solirubrobacteraceae bacterium]
MGIEPRELAGPQASLLAALRGFRVHDASPPIEPGMPMFVAYEGPELTPLFGHDEAGAAANRIAMAEHTGTHVDAPFHFDRHGSTIDRVAPDALLLRPYKKFDLTARAPAAGELIEADALLEAAARAAFTLDPGDVAIVEMGWDRHWPSGPGDTYWGRNEPGLAEDACRYLAQAGVVAVASDTAGCDVPCVDGEIGHGHGHSSWFLPRGILVVEGLRGLAEVAATGLFIALPLRIVGGTGSPVRVLLLHQGADAAA